MEEDNEVKIARREVLKEYVAATERCPVELFSYFRQNLGPFSTFIINSQHKVLPPSLRVLSNQAMATFLSTLSQYCWVSHKSRLRLNCQQA